MDGWMGMEERVVRAKEGSARERGLVAPPPLCCAAALSLFLSLPPLSLDRCCILLFFSERALVNRKYNREIWPKCHERAPLSERKGEREKATLSSFLLSFFFLFNAISMAPLFSLSLKKSA